MLPSDPSMPETPRAPGESGPAPIGLDVPPTPVSPRTSGSARGPILALSHYTYGGDLAHGIRLAMESDAALNESFNLSTAKSTTVRELAELIWLKVHGRERPLELVSDPPYEHDVQRRVPDVRKAREVLGFEAATTLDQMLDEVIPWVRDEIAAGRI